MTTFDADIPLDDDDDVGNNRRHINNDELLCYLVNQVPTINAGELAYIFDKETQYSGTFGNIKMYVHVLINKCVALLTRKKYQIKGSSLHEFFFKGSVSTSVDYQSL